MHDADAGLLSRAHLPVVDVNATNGVTAQGILAASECAGSSLLTKARDSPTDFA